MGAKKIFYIINVTASRNVFGAKSSLIRAGRLGFNCTPSIEECCKEFGSVAASCCDSETFVIACVVITRDTSHVSAQNLSTEIYITLRIQRSVRVT